jgi:hypothetical protein
MAKIVMRLIGTLLGLLGLGMVCVAPFMLYHAITERNLFMVLIAVFPLALAVYFIYVSYLIWFRLSPLAVRHMCGALGFYILTLVTKLGDPSRHTGRHWEVLIFLGCVIAVYLAYRVASKLLSKLLFSDSVS